MAANLSDDIVGLLSAADREIARLDSPANDVCRQLRAMQRRLRPLTMMIGEVARRVDISPRDALDAVLEAGVSIFWHEGQRLSGLSSVKAFLVEEHRFDPVPDLEFELLGEQSERLAAQLDVDLDELLGELASPTAGQTLPRKFIPSDARFPVEEQAAWRRQSGK